MRRKAVIRARFINLQDYKSDLELGCRKGTGKLQRNNGDTYVTENLLNRLISVVTVIFAYGS